MRSNRIDCKTLIGLLDSTESQLGKGERGRRTVLAHFMLTIAIILGRQRSATTLSPEEMQLHRSLVSPSLPDPALPRTKSVWGNLLRTRASEDFTHAMCCIYDGMINIDFW